MMMLLLLPSQQSQLQFNRSHPRMILQLLLSLTAVTVTLAWAPSTLSSNLQFPSHHRRTIVPQRTRQHSRSCITTTTIHPRMLMMVVDPNDLLTASNHMADAVVTAATAAATTTTTSPVLWDSLVSTMMSSKAALLQPAHGHSQPMFGPPDPYLTSGKSIAPSMQALKDVMSSVTANSAITTMEDTSTIESTIGAATITTTSPQLSERLQSAMQAASAKGWKVMDAATLKQESLLPGFSETQGILPRHDIHVPEETAESFAQQVEWSAQFLNVVDKLPSAALFYVVVDFFFLRPTRDVMYYKEDVEEMDPSQALVETISATSIRVGVFAVIAVLTLIIFGGGD